MRKAPGTPIPSHTEGIGDGSANSVLIPEQYGPIAEWINKHIRSPHWGGMGGWPTYDYIVDDDWADTGLAEGTVINTYTNTKIYSTVQGMLTQFASEATGSDKAAIICPGEYAENLTLASIPSSSTLRIFGVGQGGHNIAGGAVNIKPTTGTPLTSTNMRHFEWSDITFTAGLTGNAYFGGGAQGEQKFHNCTFVGTVAGTHVYVHFDHCHFVGDFEPAGGSYDVRFSNCVFHNTISAAASTKWAGFHFDTCWLMNPTTIDLTHIVECSWIGCTFGVDEGAAPASPWLTFSPSGSLSQIRINDNIFAPPHATNGSIYFEQVGSVYPYGITIIGNTFRYGAVSYIQSADATLEDVAIVGNAFCRMTGASPGYLEELVAGGASVSGNFIRSVFGPNAPGSIIRYNITGTGNDFCPTDSSSGSSGAPTDKVGVLYDGGALTVGWYGFICRFDTTIVTVAAGTLALTNTATNYVEVDAAGTVSANTTAYTLGHIPLGTVVCAGGDITTITEQSATLDESATNIFTAQSVLAATTAHTPAALTLAEQTVVGRLTGGNVAAVSLGIADNNVVQIDAADVADNEYARFTANGLESRTAAEVLADLAVPETDILAERATQAVAANTTITVTDGSPLTPFTTTGNITNTAAPFIAAGREGQLVILRNDNGTGTLTISDTNIGAGGSLLRLSANTVTMAAGSSMALAYSTIQAAWVEEWYLALVAVTPSINSHTINIGAGASNSQNAEVANAGTDTPTFAWTFTGVPSAGTVDVSAGGDPAADYPATILTPFTSLVAPAYNKGTSVGTTRTFTPSITVNGVVKTTPTATVTYINRRYMGPSSQADSLTTAQVLGLDAAASGESGLSTIRTGSFTDIDTAAGEYIWYAYRAALGAGLYFAIESEIAGFTEKQTGLSHTNDSGFVEDFRTWRSDLANFGDNKDVDVATSAGNNRFYMGPSTDADPISNANILALDDTADGESGLYSTQARTWTAIKIEAGEYLWYCHPDRIDDLATIKDGTTGFAIAGSYRTNVSHTNQYGYVEDYRCWRSDNTGIYPSGENVVVT